jgi:hypothetical protein
MRAALRVSSLLSRQHTTRCMSAAALPLSGAKRDRMVQIGTHSGSFHCDEALGCFLLKQTAKFGAADVVRTRDPEVLKTLDVVIDVGGVYEPGEAVEAVGFGTAHALAAAAVAAAVEAGLLPVPPRYSFRRRPCGAGAWSHMHARSCACLTPRPSSAVAACLLLLGRPAAASLPMLLGRPAAASLPMLLPALPHPPVHILQSLTAMTTTSGASPRCLATALTQSCPAQVGMQTGACAIYRGCSWLQHRLAGGTCTHCLRSTLLAWLLMVRPLPALPAGLVYKHYGREIMAGAMQLPADHADVEVSCAAGGAPRRHRRRWFG